MPAAGYNTPEIKWSNYPARKLTRALYRGLQAPWGNLKLILLLVTMK